MLMWYNMEHVAAQHNISTLGKSSRRDWTSIHSLPTRLHWYCNENDTIMTLSLIGGNLEAFMAISVSLSQWSDNCVHLNYYGYSLLIKQLPNWVIGCLIGCLLQVQIRMYCPLTRIIELYSTALLQCIHSLSLVIFRLSKFESRVTLPNYMNELLFEYKINLFRSFLLDSKVISS